MWTLHHPIEPKVGCPLKIAWVNSWAVSVFGYAGATSLLTPGDTEVKSAQGKSWTEWQKLQRST